MVNASACDATDGYAIIRDEAHNYFPSHNFVPQLNVAYDQDLDALVARNLSAGFYNLDFYEDYGCTESMPFEIGADNCQEPNDFALRINTGGSEIDYNGETFVADTYFNTGSTLDRPQTGLPEPYQSFRFSRSQQMNYNIPLPDGEYTVNLHFAELWFGATGGGSGGVGSRVFDVNIEGQLAEDNLDVFAEVGADAMLVKSHAITVTGGVLNIDFDSRDDVGGERHPIINAIEILGGASEADMESFIFSFQPIDYFGTEGLTFSIPIDSQYEYNYNIDWGDGTSNENVTAEISHNYQTFERFVVKIMGNFPRPLINTGNNSCGDPDLIILQWGNQKWQNLEGAFAGTLLRLEANDLPDLSECTSIRNLFRRSGMQGSGMALIPQWNISGFTDLSGLFHGTAFNEDISGWDVSHVTDMSYLFSSGTLSCGDSPGPLRGTFNQDLSAWNVSNVQNMEGMFNGSPFNHDISSWNVSGVTNMKAMFADSKFNQDISNWNVSQVTNMSYMFSGSNYGEIDRFNGDSDFNQPLNVWDVSNVTDMSGMFSSANNFNQDIGDWDVSNVDNMFNMFVAARKFNQDIGRWDVSNVTNMSNMFSDGFVYQNNDPYTFNQDISRWDVSKVTSMWSMFQNADVFNQDIGDWDVSNVTNMEGMFNGAKFFNQDISDWDVSSVKPSTTSPYNTRLSSMKDMFTNSGLSNTNYNMLLISWSQLPSLQNGVELGAPQNQYCEAEQARQHIIDTYGWTINDAGQDATCTDTTSFITTWKTDNEGFSEDNQITIPTVDGETYNYSVDWGDGSSDENVTGRITHTYNNSGTYRIVIAGDFPRLQFFPDSGAETDYGKILTIEQWGDLEWSSMFSAFMLCHNLDVVATDVPNLSNVQSMSYMFSIAESLVGNDTFSDWDVSNVIDMSRMFEGADAFNQDIGDWDVSNVTNMRSMFASTEVFNQNIGGWDVSSATKMGSMFYAAESFNQDIGNWDVFNVTSMPSMFGNTTVFNQDISGWNVSNVITMSAMFREAGAFDQNIGDWDVSNVMSMHDMFRDSGFSDENYDKALIGWSQLPSLQNGVVLGAPQNKYCDAEQARQQIIDTYDWTINDAGGVLGCIPIQGRPFITTVETVLSKITIPVHPDYAYNYTIDWGDGSINTGVAGSITHTFASSGRKTISISGNFPAIYYKNFSYDFLLYTVEQWGDIEWQTFEGAFQGCYNLDVKASDVPNLSMVTNMSNMFDNCEKLLDNSTFNTWDVSNVTDMTEMFKLAKLFNSDIGDWDVGNVETLQGTFAGAGDFNQDLSKWDVSNVVNMFATFNLAPSFDQDLGSWDIRNVSNLGFFLNNTAMSTTNYDNTLEAWANLNDLNSNLNLGAVEINYCNAGDARQKLIDDYGWTIEDAGKAADCEEAPNDFVLRINAGGTEVDYNGETFVADTYFNTGSTLDRPQTGLPEPYQSMRFSRSEQMSYDIPLEDGEYTVNLYFAELWFGATGGGAGGVGSRVFDVNIEGALAEDNLDIFAEVGADAMLMRSHTVTVTGGILDIDFNSTDAVGGERHPIINAIEIINNITSVPTLALRGKSANTNKSVLSPNPVISTTSLSFEQPVQLLDIQVFDVSGRLVLTFETAEVSVDGAYNLKVDGLESGTYFINAIDNQGIKHQKQMVIKK